MEKFIVFYDTPFNEQRYLVKIDGRPYSSLSVQRAHGFESKELAEYAARRAFKQTGFVWKVKEA